VNVITSYGAAQRPRGMTGDEGTELLWGGGGGGVGGGGGGGGGEEAGWPTVSATCFLVLLTSPLAGRIHPPVARAASIKCTHGRVST